MPCPCPTRPSGKATRPRPRRGGSAPSGGGRDRAAAMRNTRAPRPPPIQSRRQQRQRWRLVSSSGWSQSFGLSSLIACLVACDERAGGNQGGPFRVRVGRKRYQLFISRFCPRGVTEHLRRFRQPDISVVTIWLLRGSRLEGRKRFPSHAAIKQHETV